MSALLPNPARQPEPLFGPFRLVSFPSKALGGRATHLPTPAMRGRDQEFWDGVFQTLLWWAEDLTPQHWGRKPRREFERQAAKLLSRIHESLHR